jgi:hypothetical protein
MSKTQRRPNIDLYLFTLLHPPPPPSAEKGKQVKKHSTLTIKRKCVPSCRFLSFYERIPWTWWELSHVQREDKIKRRFRNTEQKKKTLGEMHECLYNAQQCPSLKGNNKTLIWEKRYKKILRWRRIWKGKIVLTKVLWIQGVFHGLQIHHVLLGFSTERY